MLEITVAILCWVLSGQLAMWAFCKCGDEQMTWKHAIPAAICGVSGLIYMTIYYITILSQYIICNILMKLLRKDKANGKTK